MKVHHFFSLGLMQIVCFLSLLFTETIFVSHPLRSFGRKEGGFLDFGGGLGSAIMFALSFWIVINGEKCPKIAMLLFSLKLASL